MIYLWEDTDSPETEIKFGDHWVPLDCSMEDAVEHTRRYIRSTLYRQKHKFDEGRIVVHGIWDASEYAKKYNRFHPKSKVDDHMRYIIGNHVHADVHRADPEVTVSRIYQELGKVGQPLRKAGLSMAQHRATENTVDAFRNGKRTVMAELCPRLGKTVYSGAVVKEMENIKLVIVASYVLSVFTSFENDWRSFEQLCDFEHVDTGKEGYEEEIDSLLKSGKKVVAYLSMCNGSKRQERIDYLFGKRYKKILVIDEADFGAHRENQAIPLIEARRPKDLVLLMTGSRGDRAVSSWDIDHYVGITYMELQVNKRALACCDPDALKYFDHCLSRDKLVVDVKYYQIGLEEVVKSSDNNWYEEEEDENIELLPSWTKFAANPMRAKGFWVRMLEAMFLGRHNIDSVNIDHQGAIGETKVAMMWLPSGITNKNLRHAVNLASEALPSFIVVSLSGGDGVTNKSAESLANDAIEKARRENKSVLFLASIIGQRSFSVPEITDVFLCYDRGDAGATAQKMSRAKTSEKVLKKTEKIARVWSASFDPNRDDKFDLEILQTARNLKHNRGLLSTKEALRLVLQSLNIHECSYDGAVRIDPDEYLEKLCQRNSLTRVMGRIADISMLNQNDIVALAEGNGDYFRLPKQPAAPSGKTRKSLPTTKGKKDKKPKKCNQIEKARKTIVAIVENMDVIIHGTGSSTISESLEKIKHCEKTQKSLEESMGVTYDMIQYLIDKGVIRQEYLELIYDSP
jgi:hypothetical protein